MSIHLLFCLPCTSDFIILLMLVSPDRSTCPYHLSLASGHVERSGDTNIRRIMKSEVQGHRSRGRQKKRCMDMFQEDLKFLNLKPDDTGRRDMWRQRIRVADPSPAGD